MKTTSKMSSEERRAAIIQAVRKVFAEKGFHGTTTRELARAAGVSEALLFKHFPNKEALYSAILHLSSQEKDQERLQRLLALEPSTSSLVIIVHQMASRFVRGPRPGNEEEAIRVRLLQRSLLGDGDFARLVFQRVATCIVPKVEACLQAAVVAGDAIEGPISRSLMAWFTQHLAMMIMLHLLPETPVVDYGVSRERLVEQAVWFALRGMGLKEEAIQRYYNPETLAQFAS